MGTYDVAASFTTNLVDVPHWYAVYTYVHQERHVEERLKFQDFKTVLPLYSKIQRWGTRRVKLEQPLFTGYVFVRFCLEERLRVLTTSGVCRIVGRGSQPEPLRDAEVDGLIEASTLYLKLEPHPPVQVGRRVRIKAGPFEGLEGVLIRRKGKFRAIISLDALASGFVFDIDEYDIEAIWPVTSKRLV